jgi:hypothetical protein
MPSSWACSILRRVWVLRSRKLSASCRSSPRESLSNRSDRRSDHLAPRSSRLFTHSFHSFLPRVLRRCTLCVCVVVVLLLHHLGPYPFEPPFSIDPRRPALVGMMAPSSQSVLHVAGRLSFRFFTIRYGRVLIYWLFCTASFLQNRGDTTAETIAGLFEQEASCNHGCTTDIKRWALSRVQRSSVLTPRATPGSRMRL